MGFKCILVFHPENNPKVVNGIEDQPINVTGGTDGKSLDFA